MPCHYAVCRYAVCHYAECHYAECHYAAVCRYAEWHDTSYFDAYPRQKKFGNNIWQN